MSNAGLVLALIAVGVVDGALAAAFARHGQSARVGVITQGADIMARFVAKA